MLLAFLLLVASSTAIDLVNESYQIPDDGWYWVPVDLQEHAALVKARFEVENGSRGVRLLLLTQGEFERLRDRRDFRSLAVSRAGQAGELRYRARQTGRYVLVVDNREAREIPTAVRLHATLDFAQVEGAEVTHVSPQRQLVVILLSFGFFFGVVTYSAKKMLRATRRE
jgi:hypothetical protein